MNYKKPKHKIGDVVVIETVTCYSEEEYQKVQGVISFAHFDEDKHRKCEINRKLRPSYWVYSVKLEKAHIDDSESEEPFIQESEIIDNLSK